MGPNVPKSPCRFVGMEQLQTKPRVSSRVLPNMGHTGLLVKSGLPNKSISWQYAPGYWEGMEHDSHARLAGAISRIS